MRREYERARCPICLREIAAYVPRWGDGSDVKLVPHVNPDTKRHCTGSDQMVGELWGEGGRSDGA